MNSDWIRALSPEDQNTVREVLKNKALTDGILLVLDKLEAEEERREVTLVAYENPAWPYMQAHTNGAKRAYNRIRSLFKQDSKTNG